MKYTLESISSGVEEGPTIERRTFLGKMFMAGAALAMTTAVMPNAAAREESQEKEVSLSDLSKGPEDVYLLLFENNPNDRRKDDEFIAEAAAAAGYQKPYQWHVEIMYFKKESQEWMVMGCRPPHCSLDYPLKTLLRTHGRDNVRVNHLKIPIGQQKKAREIFIKTFQGKAFSLLGPSATNCADVPDALAAALELKGARKLTRRHLLSLNSVKEFLTSREIDGDEIMARDSIIFPDEYESWGEKLGILKF
jgi:hypothetical protein